MTGVSAGNLEAAHLAAFGFVKRYVTVPVERRCDLVVTHGGRVAINHYQSVKAGSAGLCANWSAATPVYSRYSGLPLIILTLRQ